MEGLVMRKLRGVHLAAGFFAVLLLISLFADFLSSNPPAMQDLNMFYHPPERIHFFDGQGQLQKPFIYKTELSDPLDASYKENTAEAYPLEFFFKGYSYTILGLFSSDRHLIGRAQYPRYYPLGSDDLGRDVLARVLAGTRTSLLVVGLGIILYSTIGLAVGVFAGLFGGFSPHALFGICPGAAGALPGAGLEIDLAHAHSFFADPDLGNRSHCGGCVASDGSRSSWLDTAGQKLRLC
jgi:ABC-type dipeptide/oligopeptide/nickel transport system permease subunit